MLTVEETSIDLASLDAEKDGLADCLQTYVGQFNSMAKTYQWIRNRLTSNQQAAWVSTIDALKRVCLALDAGFEPFTPPSDWGHHRLERYIAPIPAHVRERIDKALTIFRAEHLLIYDPNPEHFVQPETLDPLAVGSVDLRGRRLHFLVGQWDLDADLAFIDGQPIQERTSAAVTDAVHPRWLVW